MHRNLDKKKEGQENQIAGDETEAARQNKRSVTFILPDSTLYSLQGCGGVAAARTLSLLPITRVGHQHNVSAHTRTSALGPNATLSGFHTTHDEQLSTAPRNLPLPNTSCYSSRIRPIAPTPHNPIRAPSMRSSSLYHHFRPPTTTATTIPPDNQLAVRRTNQV
ncbi:hypothetical protein E2C01_025939 [Portunus trituberculatus]|uniref:Uncharacterized protein n=1 Tax=Portunus trituberculatus TaxID=210409 RepID=A0A5B7EGT2_PORTR|nr:hypothetical protein [Portunus trituberculatus]